MTTSTEYREAAAANEAEAAASFERSDTDGCMSQWANTVTADLHRRQAEIADNGDRARFCALFDLDGNLVPAKLVSGRYGRVWGLLPNDDPRASFTGWFNPSNAENENVRRRNNAKKGYYEGTVLAPAAARLGGSGTGMAGALTVHTVIYRTDGGFSRDVEIVDNGH